MGRRVQAVMFSFSGLLGSVGSVSPVAGPDALQWPDRQSPPSFAPLEGQGTESAGHLPLKNKPGRTAVHARMQMHAHDAHARARTLDGFFLLHDSWS